MHFFVYGRIKGNDANWNTTRIYTTNGWEIIDVFKLKYYLITLYDNTHLYGWPYFK